MENYTFNGDTEKTAKKVVEQEGLDSSEEGFMKGYSDDEEIEECVECGSAIEEENRTVKEIDGELVTFCSKACAEEFEENLN